MKRVFEVRHGTLTGGEECLLVNASNTNLNLGTGVSGAIRQACGAGYQDQIHQLLFDSHGGPIPPGQVFITHAGAHPTAEYVAHVAVMDYRNGFTSQSYPSLSLIRSAYTNLWESIEELDLSAPLSIAMVALGAGTGQIGARNSIEVACETLKDHLADQSNIGDVTFYAYELHEFLVTVEIVVKHFDLNEDAFSDDVRRYLADRRTDGP